MKHKKDNASESHVFNDRAEPAGYSRNRPACSVTTMKHIFNMTVNDSKPSSSTILKNNIVQNSMPDPPCIYSSDVPQNISQNSLTRSNYRIIDHQLKQVQQNFPCNITYNVLPEHASYNHGTSIAHQQQHFHTYQQQPDYSTTHYSQSQEDNLLQSQWNFGHMQSNNDTNSYEQVQNDYVNVNIANNISNQIVPNFMSQNDENRFLNSMSCLTDLQSWLVENTNEQQQLINGQVVQSTCTDPIESQNINTNLLNL